MYSEDCPQAIGFQFKTELFLENTPESFLRSAHIA